MSNNALAGEIFTKIKSGDRAALSRAITLVESRRVEDRRVASALLRLCMAEQGDSVRVAISGPPGVGKSSLIEALGMRIIDSGKRLAVLAIDPSSDRSGGSILGDKTRMLQLASRPEAFVRPSPSGGHLGGVARKTREATILCEAAGYPVVFIETVGVGQSEYAAYELSDLFLLVLMPGGGDELQGIKRGIVELADMLVINKADGDQERIAQQTKLDYQKALRLFPHNKDGRSTEVGVASALTGKGIAELWAAVSERVAQSQSSGAFRERRARQSVKWMEESFQQHLNDRLASTPGFSREKERLTELVLKGQLSPFQAAEDLLTWIKW